MKYAYIAVSRSQYSLASLCRALQVSRSAFMWQGRGTSARAQSDAALLIEIRRIHREHRQACGALKTWHVLRREGVPCGKHRVARLRKRDGIEANRKRRFRVIIEHHQTPLAAPDRLERRFLASAPNRAWVGDITFIRTREGWLNLAVLLDLYSRKVVGWAMGTRPDKDLALAALNMALAHRAPPPGLIHHTDRGATYSAAMYRDRLQAAGALPSMSGRKSAYDNAVAESFFSSLKNELVHHRDFPTRDYAKAAIFDYIEVYYNRQRLHQTLGYRTPEEVDGEWRNA
ncbi:IS3 family transposase [Ectothiorhodospiraceae bacterium 2226]|nr:IS3 family transposase [Ectothiorhodospiraceae bacterium 2226]